MKFTFRILFSLIITSLLLNVIGVTWILAQGENEPSGFNSVHLWIYPEYDDPRLLVMLEGQVIGIETPATVRFLVPSTAVMYSAGSIDTQGHYTGGPPHREPSTVQGWDEISYEVTSRTFRVEYYDPIILGWPDKTISYEFRSLIPITSFHVLVQEPRQSSGFNVLPSGETSSDNQGFTNHIYEYYDLDIDSSIQFNISYTKSSNLPSLSIEDGEPSYIALIVTTVIGVCIILGFGLFWILKSKPKNRAEKKRKYRNKSPNISKGRNNQSVIFCSQCGKSLEKSARFCQYCGTKITSKLE